MSGIVLVPPHLEHVLVLRWRQQVMSDRLRRTAASDPRGTIHGITTLSRPASTDGTRGSIGTISVCLK